MVEEGNPKHAAPDIVSLRNFTLWSPNLTPVHDDDNASKLCAAATPAPPSPNGECQTYNSNNYYRYSCHY